MCSNNAAIVVPPVYHLALVHSIPEITHEPHTSHKVPPHPINVAMVPTPMVPCARSLGKECHPSVDPLVPHTINTDAENRQGSNFAATSAPSPSTNIQPVPMVPPSWPCLLYPNEKLTAQATHQQAIIRLKH